VAGNYATTSSRPNVKTLDGQTVIDVQAIGIVTKPTGIRFTVPVPKTTFDQGGAEAILAFAATEVEALTANVDNTGNPLISGGSGSQQIDNNGLLAYFINLIVSYTPATGTQGTYTEVVTLPVSVFESSEAYIAGINGVKPVDLVVAAYERLRKLAAA